jgi:hypothetical protein
MSMGVALSDVKALPTVTYEQFLQYTAGNIDAARKPQQDITARSHGRDAEQSNTPSTTDVN